VQHLEAKQADYEAASRRAERRLIIRATDLLEDAEPDELGELFRAALDAVIVERGRGPIANRVRIIPRIAPETVWLPPVDSSSP
jgi:hypothetical protein